MRTCAALWKPRWRPAGNTINREFQKNVPVRHLEIRIANAMSFFKPGSQEHNRDIFWNVLYTPNTCGVLGVKCSLRLSFRIASVSKTLLSGWTRVLLPSATSSRRESEELR
jgi:hypothetical protein